MPERTLTTRVGLLVALHCQVLAGCAGDRHHDAMHEAGRSGAPTAGVSGEHAGSSGASDADIPLTRASTPAQTSPAISDSDYATFLAHINQFGLDLGRATLAAENLGSQNFVYSPLSATLALAMAYAGARGQTEQEMKLVLGDTFSETTFHAGCNRVTRELASRVMPGDGADPPRNKLDLVVTNALFADRGLALKDEFLQLLAAEYDSGVRRVDFRTDSERVRQAINAWVSRETHDTIQDLIPAGAVNSTTGLVLVDALYFYASWSQPFSARVTSNAAFYPLAGDAVQVPMMHASERLEHAETEDLAVVDLRYIGGRLRLTIVLPHAGKFEAVRKQVSAAWLEQTTSQLASKAVNLSIPKFRIDSSTFELKQALQSLGMKSAFDEAADFSGIAPSWLAIARVLQKAFISVDENGTEAAAATAVIAGGSGAPVMPIPFTADRPFLFFLRDAGGAILFAGQVVDPS